MILVEHIHTVLHGLGVDEAHLGSAQPHGFQQVCSCGAAAGGPVLRCPRDRAQEAWQQCHTAPCLHLECMDYLQAMADMLYVSAVQYHAQLGSIKDQALQRKDVLIVVICYH